MFSDTFAGIAPSSVLPFIAAQVLGGVLAAGIIRALYPSITPADAADIIVPHSAGRAPSRAGYDGALPSPDRPPGPVQSP
jgi:arsenate reductase